MKVWKTILEHMFPVYLILDLLSHSRTPFKFYYTVAKYRISSE